MARSTGSSSTRPARRGGARGPTLPFPLGARRSHPPAARAAIFAPRLCPMSTTGGKEEEEEEDWPPAAAAAAERARDAQAAAAAATARAVAMSEAAGSSASTNAAAKPCDARCAAKER